jgi:predicted enzyme related to lactoylglutathione lyase
MNSVIHFEMPYDNPERVARFYHTAFGWETQMTGEEMGNYVLATTTETDSDRRPTHPGAINGGFFRKQTDRPAQVPSVVIAVENMTEARDRVTRAGGQVLGDPMEIPGVGMYVSFLDPEGNRVAMLEPSRQDRERGREHEKSDDSYRGPARR